MPAQILVIKPKSLTATEKKTLREAGVICIESSEPDSIRFLQCDSPPLTNNDLFWAAIKAIGEGPSTTTKSEFANNVMALTKANRDMQVKK